MKETCACTASFEITDVAQWATDALLEQFQAWRENHLHEFPPAEPEGLTVVESASSHERALPFGFAPEPEDGWA